MQLYQGAVGTIGLSEAQARASLDQQQRLSFKVGLAPDLRQGGSIRVSGLLPLLPVLPMVRLAPACSRHFPWHVPCQCIAFGCPPPPSSSRAFMNAPSLVSPSLIYRAALPARLRVVHPFVLAVRHPSAILCRSVVVPNRLPVLPEKLPPASEGAFT